MDKKLFRTFKKIFKAGFYLTLVFLLLHSYEMYNYNVEQNGRFVYKQVIEWDRIEGAPPEVAIVSKQFARFRYISLIAIFFLVMNEVARYIENPKDHYLTALRERVRGLQDE